MNTIANEIIVSYKKNEIISDLDMNLKTSLEVSNFLKKIYPVDINLKEAFVVIFFNNQMKINGYSTISIGGLDATIVDVRNIMQIALTSNSNGIILSHNHPSGKLTPSEADRKITERIKTACKYLDIKLIDHIIITEDSYYSFADNSEL